MKTLKELYSEVMASKELKHAYYEAANAGKLEDFLKEHGCDATRAELDAFLSDYKNLPQGEISDDELDAVAGGCDHGNHTVVTWWSTCGAFVCEDCHSHLPDTNYAPDVCLQCGNHVWCCNCVYFHYEDGLCLCYLER